MFSNVWRRINRSLLFCMAIYGRRTARLALTAPIFDPACYWGDRECDLAMLPLHTDQPPQIYDGYQSVSPLPLDFLDRQPIYQLYTLLNRARLFGGQHGYCAKSDGSAACGIGTAHAGYGLSGIFSLHEA